MPTILGLDTWLRQSHAEDHGVIFEDLGLKTFLSFVFPREETTCWQEKFAHRCIASVPGDGEPGLQFFPEAELWLLLLQASARIRFFGSIL